MQQRSRFQRALAAANHQHALAVENRQIAPIHSVRNQRWRQAFEFGRTSCERSDAARHNHAPGREFLAIRRRQFKTTIRFFDHPDPPRVQIRRHFLLKPTSIIHEAFQRNWRGQMVATRRHIRIQRQLVLGVCDMTGRPGRAQKHSRWHMAFPKRHRFAEHARV